MLPDSLQNPINSVPSGSWAVGVSGGADSVALLLLLLERTDLHLHAIHLNHQTRGSESDEDAVFVQELCQRHSLPCTIALRRDVESSMPELNSNSSARYRAARRALFRQVIKDQGLSGVILAHHADDQAETVLHRLLRGSGPKGLTGMRTRTRHGDLTILRPLLSIRRQSLRSYLHEIHEAWREDPSNASDKYLRNRLRKLLSNHPDLTDSLLALAEACRILRAWTQIAAPRLDEAFAAARLAALPSILASQSARQWLIDRGIPPKHLVPEVLDRIISMVRDAATPPQQHFPGNKVIRRRAGRVFIQP